MQTESRTQGWGGRGNKGAIAKADKVSFSGNENVMKLTVVIIVHMCEDTKNH